MKLKPIGGKILVRVQEGKEKTETGLFIPEQAREKSQEGVVEDLGSGGRDEQGNLIPFDVTIGETILFTRYAGGDIKLDGKSYKLITQDDILAIVS